MGNASNENNVYYKINKNKYFIPIGIIVYLLIMAPRAYALCQIKYLMDSKYISYYKILIIYGFVGTVISTIIGAISSFIPCYNNSIKMKICNILNENNQSYYFESFYLYWKTQRKINNIIIELANFTFGIITNVLYSFYFILLIKYLTPMHFIFLNLTYSFFLSLLGILNGLIKGKIETENKGHNVIMIVMGLLDYIIRVLVFFGLLVYLEMIELNFCNFNYGLKKNIIERSIKEYELNKIGGFDNVNEDKRDKMEKEENENNEEEGNEKFSLGDDSTIIYLKGISLY